MPEESPNAPAETPGDATQVEDAPRRTVVTPEEGAAVGPTRV
jgi:hypothetical protein